MLPVEYSITHGDEANRTAYTVRHHGVMHSDASKAQAKGNAMIPLRIKLKGAFCGNRYSWAGIGGPEDDWSIPTHSFDIKNIIGQYLVPLKRCCCGKHLVPERICSRCKLQVQPAEGTCHLPLWQLPIAKCHHCNGHTETVTSEAPVNALVDTWERIRTCGTLADHSLADSDNVVSVTFGRDQCREDFDIRSEADLSMIQTPTTPSPCSTP